VVRGSTETVAVPLSLTSRRSERSQAGENGISKDSSVSIVGNYILKTYHGPTGIRWEGVSNRPNKLAEQEHKDSTERIIERMTVRTREKGSPLIKV
jgi:hypothetical protein